MKGTLSNKVLLTLLAIEMVLVVLFVITSLLPDYNIAFISAATVKRLHVLFHIGLEKNIPSAFSALQLLCAGSIAIYCLRTDGAARGLSVPRSLVWFLVCLIFLYLAWDEYFTFHEGFGQVFEKSAMVSPDFITRLGGYLNDWTIVAAFIAMIVGTAGFIAFRKMFSECSYLFYLLLLAGFLFVAGAIGLENIQTYLVAHNINIFHLPFFFQIAEEFLEMFGVSLTIFVFIRYIEETKRKA